MIQLDLLTVSPSRPHRPGPMPPRRPETTPLGDVTLQDCPRCGRIVAHPTFASHVRCGWCGVVIMEVVARLT